MAVCITWSYTPEYPDRTTGIDSGEPPALTPEYPERTTGIDTRVPRENHRYWHRSTQREPPAFRKTLANYHIQLYRLHLATRENRTRNCWKLLLHVINGNFETRGTNLHPVLRLSCVFDSPLTNSRTILRECVSHMRENVGLVSFMVLNATFNHISVISWLSVLLVVETGVPGENHRPVASNWHD